MKRKLSYLVVGDSQVGKSSFIRTFTLEKIAKILNISGKGQTTRCNCIYRFSAKNNEINKVQISFYTKDEFVDKYVQEIMSRCINKDIIKPENDSIDPNNKSLNIRNNISKELLEKICGENLIDSEFIKLSEFGLDSNDGILIEKIEEDIDIEKYITIISEKLEKIYYKIKKKVEILINNIKKIEQKQETEKNIFADNIEQLEFKFDEESAKTFEFCIKQIQSKKKRIPGVEEITSISGIVKQIELNLPLNNDYSEICNSVGIDEVELIDTYGLDHAIDENNSVIDGIRKRFSKILNEEFRQIESVFFILPMEGKAPGANKKFKALIEAKRSIIPHVVYTKFDLYIEDYEDEKLFDIDKDEFGNAINEFNKNDINNIKNDFQNALREYYSVDIAEYRRKCILNNFTYFMNTYEIENKLSQNVARENNTVNFKKIILAALKNNNYGLTVDMIKFDNFIEHIDVNFEENKNEIKHILQKMLDLSQNELNDNYFRAYGNTQNAFWRRINANMFGFYGELNIRRILLDKYDNFISKDTGSFKDKNIGTLLVDKFISDNDLNVFLRECINHFGSYFFCAGCTPCEALKPEKCHMSKACNTTGIYERKRRNGRCYKYENGEYIGSREYSSVCANTGIYGVGLFNKEYGLNIKCDKYCFWEKMFRIYKENNNIKFNSIDIVNSFKNVFIEFCKKKYIKSIYNLKNIEYLEGYEVEITKSIDEEHKLKHEEIIENSDKQYIILTEGETDKIHLQIAWSQLYANKAIEFDIYCINGASKMSKFLQLYPADMHKEKIFIGIFDYDNEGVKQFENGGKFTAQKDEYIRKYQNGDSNEKNRKYYLMLLPPINDEMKKSKNGCIEFFYSKELLKRNNVIKKMSIANYIKNKDNPSDDYIKKIISSFDNKDDISVYEINNNSKVKFANEISDISKYNTSDFEGFKIIFDELEKIFNYEK